MTAVRTTPQTKDFSVRELSSLKLGPLSGGYFCVKDYLSKAILIFREDGTACGRTEESRIFASEELPRFHNEKAFIADREGQTILIINPKGDIVKRIPGYYYISDFVDGIAVVFKQGKPNPRGKNYSIHYLNDSGNIVFNHLSYESFISTFSMMNGGDLNSERTSEVYPLHEGLRRVYKNGKFGYVNESGKVLIPFQFEDASDFYEGRAFVTEDSVSPRWGMIDVNGNYVVEPIYRIRPSDFHNGLSLVKKDNAYNAPSYFIDRSGAKLSPEYRAASDFHAGFAFVRDDTKCRMVDTTFQEVNLIPISSIPESISETSETMYISGRGIYTLSGHFLFGDRDLTAISGELTPYRSGDGKVVGYANRNGELVIRFVEK